MSIKHKQLATVEDGPSDGRVQPSWWNDDHDIGPFLSAIVALAVTPGTVPYIKADGTAGAFALSDFARALLSLADAPAILAGLGAAALDSPNFINQPTAPTAPLNTNTAQIATMAALQAMRADLVASSPATLDTLNELAAALGSDPNFSVTMTNALAARLRFDAAQTLTTGQQAQALINLGVTLGTAAALNVGTGASQIVQLDGSAKLPAVDGSALTNITPSGLAFGQCVLKLSGGNLVLLPYQGNRLTINGVSCSVPDAGVTLAPTGLTVATKYYIYAVATAGVVTSLEASATTHATSTTAGNKGVEIKSGDNTRSLVGMVYIDTGPAFADSVTKRYVRSWFNDNGRSLTNGKSGSTASAGNTLLGMSVGFLVWAGEIADALAVGYSYNSFAAPGGYGVQLCYDGLTTNPFGDPNMSSPGSQTFFQMPFSASGVLAALAEGFHTIDLAGMAGSGGGTLTYVASIKIVTRR